jgi:hypothetical protein
MTSLRELQNNFIHDCLSAELTDNNILLAKDIHTTNISAKGLMGIYRESSIGNIITPMQLTYPVVERLVGEDFFRMSCRKFTETHWPKTGNMDDYGSEFAEFLEQFKPAQSIPYLPDVARLEWLYHESSIADDMESCDWTEFSTLSADDVADVSIHLHPSVRLFSSPYPVMKIWQMNQENADQNEELDLDNEGRDSVLILRANFKPSLHNIDSSEIILLQSLLEGNPLFEAVELALEINDDINMQAFMERHISIGTFCGFSTT